jgi:hypothetical protein
MLRNSWLVVRIYGKRYAIAVPLAAALVSGVVALLLAPDGLANDHVHNDYDGFFGTVGQLIGTLIVALVVEARAPFTRTGTVVARAIAAAAIATIGIGGVAAVLGLSPGLSDCLYQVCFALSCAALAAGFLAVVLLGASLMTGTLREVENAELERLKDLGDLEAAEKLLRNADSW